MRKRMLYLLMLVALLGVAVFLLLRLPVFGAAATGERLARMQRSPNYRDGTFRYPLETPVMDPNASYWALFRAYLKPVPNRDPDRPLPSVKTDLNALADGSVVWFGHSSYLLRLDGRTLLVDPVFSGQASPVPGLGAKAYPGTGVYSVADLPRIDAVVITHNHYDHLDYETIRQLISKTGTFHTALGVGADLEHWGVPASAIREYDWHEGGPLADGFRLTAVPARHFSGRGLTRNQTLWTAFVLQTPTYRLFLGGDSGYGPHFRQIGDRFGPFDLALLEAGQYNEAWALIHLMPEETVRAAADLRAHWLLPVHWGKFTLALHPWTEPVERVLKQAETASVNVTTPRIGEPVRLGTSYPRQPWWR